MNWPNDAACKRIAALWAIACRASSNHGERANAVAALKRLQADLDLDDTELAFVAESYANSNNADAPPDVLQQILGLFDAQHIVIPSLARATIVALWVLHTHVFEQFLHTPRLHVDSLEVECGKTALLTAMKELTPNAFYTGSITPATIYRKLAEGNVSFFLDDVENSTLRRGGDLLVNVLDMGHRQGGCVGRVVDGKPVEFPCFGPLALAGVAEFRFPPQLVSRAIKIDMEKSPEGKDQLWPNDARFRAARALISEWAATFKRPENCRVPFIGRAGDNFRVLIEIAETLGYGETARAAALAIHQPSDDPVVRLLFDIRTIFEQRAIDRIWTSELLRALYELENAKWDEFWGLKGDKDPHKLHKGELYRLLRTKKIQSRTVWKIGVGGRKSANGFLREQFEAVWRQLFPDTPTQSSKIIALPRHRKQHTGGTGEDFNG
jgi:hypothetical protein